MKYELYPKYKDSGVEWIGEIPEEWEIARFRHVLEANDGGAWGDEPLGDGHDRVVLRSTEQTVDGRWELNEPALRKLRDAEFESTRLQDGDLLVTKSSGSDLHIGKTTLVTPDIASLECGYSNFMQRLRMSTCVSPYWAWLFLNNRVSRDQFAYLSNSTTGLSNLSARLIGDSWISFPTRTTQSSIASFLDTETAKIDTLVREYEDLTNLLTEKRQALISHAVTRGLSELADPQDPEFGSWAAANLATPVRFVDSGVEWLGEIPEGWTVTPLMRLTPDDRPIMYGIVLPGPDVDDGVMIVKGGDVKAHRLNPSTLKRTTREIESGYARSRLKAGDIVFSIRGSIGDAEIIPAEVEGANLTQDAARIAPLPSVNNRWLLQALRADSTFAQLDSSATGATIRGINIFSLKRAFVPVPLGNEQSAIAAFLTRETAKIDTLVRETQNAIDLLKEHRSALITATVTGKINVEALG